MKSLIWSWVMVLSIYSNMLYAAPKAELIPFWNHSDERSTQQIEHSDWQFILDNYLDTQHPSAIYRFNYAKLVKQSADYQRLNRYLSYLQQLNPLKYSKLEQKAYWINLYNALTVQIVLQNYPVKSISKIHKSWFGFGPWDDVIAEVIGKKLTLNNIEHGILRPIWQDNLIHYAVNCASMSCPNLAPKAYTAANTEELLQQAAKNYINHPRGVQFKQKKLFVSSIYFWYKIDFGGTNAGLIQHFLKYAKPDLARQLRRYKGDIKHDYNWQLNQP